MLLTMDHINKSFFGAKVLDDVHFDLKRGEVHALIGENGAGKSTLMKILSGALASDGGDISIDSKNMRLSSPHEANKAGVAIIHQELMLAEHLTIAENLLLGREPAKYGVIDKKQMFSQAQGILDSMDIRLDAREPVERLTVAQKQLVEIAKSISRTPRILIMDEPTSAIAAEEVNALLERIEHLKTTGVGIIYISHKMEEVMRIADRVTVLRDGQYIGTLQGEEIELSTIIEMMVGRKETLDFHRNRGEQAAENILEIKNLSNSSIRNVSFQLKKGEILGVAGLMGAGRSETMRAIFGIDELDSGEIWLEGKRIRPSPSAMIREGVGFAPEDRKQQALFLDMALYPNVVTAQMRKRRGGWRSISEEKVLTKRYINDLSIKTTGISQTVKNLSGGNQQKTVVARWLAIKPKILILDEPTRGIDVGAKSEIYEMLSEMADSGISILVVSSELQEVLAIADRIIVMSGGKVSGELMREEASQKRIMEFALS